VTQVRYASRAGRAVLLATIVGSGVAFLDTTVVNVALPPIARSLGAGFSTMQWVLDAYLLSLGALVLVGGAVGDVLGRRRVFVVGLLGFGVTSAVCGAAPNADVLIAGPILANPIKIEDGKLTARGPGLGIEWNETAIAKYLV
jgi:MFS family permease